MANKIMQCLSASQKMFRTNKYIMVNGKRVLCRIEYKAVNAYTYKTSHGRDLIKTNTGSDR